MVGVSRDTPKISVIIPAHNEQRFLNDAIASISNQTFNDFELLVVNNGSRDATGQIIGEWSLRDRRVRHLTLDRASLNQSLRQGAAHTSGMFIARMDADDIAAPDRLRRQYETMVRNPPLGLLGSYAQVITQSGKSRRIITFPLTDYEIRLALRNRCTFVHSSVMMRREAYVRAGGYRPGLNLAEDYDLWLRMMSVTEMANLPEALVKYREHGDSLSGRCQVQLAVSALCVSAAVTARQLGVPEPFADGRPVLRRALPLLGLGRGEVRWAIKREAFIPWYLNLRAPSFLKEGIRRALIACGLKPFLLHFFTPLTRLKAINAQAFPVTRWKRTV